MSKNKEIIYIKFAWSFILIVGFIAMIFALHNDIVFVIKLIMTLGLIATLFYILNEIWSNK